MLHVVPPPPADDTAATTMKTPDITPAQVLAVLTGIIGVLSAFGLDVSDAARDAILQLATALVVFLPVADAVIRHGRAKIAVAQIHATNPPPATEEVAA